MFIHDVPECFREFIAPLAKRRLKTELREIANKIYTAQVSCKPVARYILRYDFLLDNIERWEKWESMFESHSIK